MSEFNIPSLHSQIDIWLSEDLGTGDITSLTTIPLDHQSKGIVHAKEAGVLAGLPIARTIVQKVDPEVTLRLLKKDGEILEVGDYILELEGSSRSILQMERLLLNILQHCSGIATKTREYVEAIAGYEVNIVDTRKTTPGLRQLEKYAVRMGGGNNHRFGLYDAVMIKDNHIKAAGSIAAAIRSARANIPHTMKIEVETESFEEVAEAITERADIIMLDNMSLDHMREAVIYIKKHAPHVLIEASGGVTLERVREIAACGIDYISIGGLTSSIQSLDISLDLNEIKKELKG